jgi:hypothetical protein
MGKDKILEQLVAIVAELRETDLIEETALIVEQNVILLERRETDVRSLLPMQEKLDGIQARDAEACHQYGAAQAGVSKGFRNHTRWAPRTSMAITLGKTLR